MQRKKSIKVNMPQAKSIPEMLWQFLCPVPPAH